jgi:SAM-dependent methyltransferase
MQATFVPAAALSLAACAVAWQCRSAPEPEPEPEPGPEPEPKREPQRQPEPQPESEQPEAGALGTPAASAAAAAAASTKPSMPPLDREVTTYRTPDGAAVAVEGYLWISDAHGGNLSAHGKHTGEAFWHVSRMLADYLCWDCPALQPEAPSGQRVVDLGCGLGLVGLVAATRLDASGRVDLTDGDAEVVNRAAESALANSSVTRAGVVSASVLWWDDAAAIAALNAAAAAAPPDEAERFSASSSGSGGGSYDLVLASDCIYENGAPEVAVGMAKALAKTAQALLRPEPINSLPLRGQSSAEDWHSWIDTSDGAAIASDEFVWPPRTKETQAAKPEAEGPAAPGVAGGSAAAGGSRPRPMCAVGFGRRNVPLEVLLDAFEAEGFECHVPSAGNQDDEDVPGDGYYEDIFQVRKDAFLAPFETQNDLSFLSRLARERHRKT